MREHTGSSWRRRLKTSIELYEEAKRLWEEIYRMREEKETLQFGSREYAVYLVLKKHKVNSRKAVELTQKLLERVKNEIETPGWTSNPALVKNVQRKIAFFILSQARELGLPVDKATQLIGELVKKVQEYGAQHAS